MGILDKVRDFFYDEEEYEETVKIKPEKHPVKEKKEKKDKIKFVETKEPKKEKQDISERELFKVERTFNFPFDVDDEEEIVPTKENKTEVVPEVKKVEEKPVETKTYNTEYKQTKPFSIRNYEKYEKEKKEEAEDKKFKPTPVISPIYGILDKNYKKEDLLIDEAKSIEKETKLDYGEVRKRAYSKSTKKEDEKGIFYNLDDDNKKEEDEVKIVYNDVELEEEKEEDKNKTIGEKIEEYEKSLEKEDIDDETDENILSETKEQDLFNLIDNMYNSDEDDFDEEE